jgi:hypothetical protein
MTSAAQVLANRSNARKSTGPRTPEGKAAAARNAVKHGLLAEQVVIKGEDPEEFDLYRAGMLAELAPVGAVEALLAERAVSLSWRLRRAERLQSAVFATVYRENANDVVLWPKHGLPIKPGPDEDEVVLGQVVMTDFGHAQVLDRLLVYERRIESSLYRTMAQLRREREARAAASELEGVSRLESGPPAGQEAAAPVRLASFGADAVPGSQTRETALGSSEPLVDVAFGTGMGTPNAELCVGDPILPVVGNHGQDAHATETPCGVTMNMPTAVNHGPDARATGTPCGVAANDEGRAIRFPAETLHDRSCQTKPI